LIKNLKFKIKNYWWLILILLLGLAIILLVENYHFKSSNNPPLISPSIISSPSPILVKAKVVKVIDGDSVQLDTGEQVRYIGINTPEFSDKYNNYKKQECFASEAKKANTALVLNQEVELAKDISETDKYNRLLRYVYVEDEMINDFLIRWGFAKIDTVPPDTKFSQQFADAQKEAQGNHRGLWSKCQP